MSMPTRRATKIVATLGPASSDPALLEAMIRAGVNVVRLNFSHGTHEDHRARYDAVRQVEAETGRPIAILADLQGPKLRIGTFAAGKVAVSAGDTFVLDRLTPHQLIAHEGDVKFVEISTFHRDSDSYRVWR